MSEKAPSTTVGVRIKDTVLKDFDALAKAANLDRSGYTQLWFGVISRLKKEHAIAGLTSIPPEMLKGFPGRPTDAEADKSN